MAEAATPQCLNHARCDAEYHFYRRVGFSSGFVLRARTVVLYTHEELSNVFPGPGVPCKNIPPWRLKCPGSDVLGIRIRRAYHIEQNRDPQRRQTLKNVGSCKKKQQFRIPGLGAPRRPLRVPGAQDMPGA